LVGLNYFPIAMAKSAGIWQGDVNGSEASTGWVSCQGGLLIQAIPMKIGLALVTNQCCKGCQPIDGMHEGR
jgi:hypothetical protein